MNNILMKVDLYLNDNPPDTEKVKVVITKLVGIPLYLENKPTYMYMGKWLQGGHFIRELGKKCLTPGLGLNLCSTGFFIRKVPLARFECWSNKTYLFLKIIQ